MTGMRRLAGVRGPFNRAALVEAVSQNANLTATAAGKAVEAMLLAITDALRDGQEVRLTGFGSFVIAQRKASAGRNPRTGAAIELPPSVSVRFRPGKILKDAVS